MATAKWRLPFALAPDAKGMLSLNDSICVNVFMNVLNYLLSSAFEIPHE